MSVNTKIVKTYAKSLFQNLANSTSSSKTEDAFTLSKLTSSESKTFSPTIFIIGEELLLLRAIFISSEKLKTFFKNPTYSESKKLEILFSVFPGLTVTTKSFLKVLTERSHLSLIPQIDEYTTILLKYKNLTKVKLITASPLEDSYGSLLLKTLKKVTQSNEIILSIAYNPKLLGGIVLEFNSVAIDASILKEFSLFFNDI